MFIFKILFQFLLVTSIIKNIIGKKKFKKLSKQIMESSEFKFFSYLSIVLMLIVGVFYAFLVGTIKILEGELVLGIIAFSLMSTATIYFAFTNYNLIKY